MTRFVEVWQDDLPQGTLYWPGNAAARALAGRLGFPYFEAATLDHFRRAGVEIVVLGRATPHPTDYQPLRKGNAP